MSVCDATTPDCSGFCAASAAGTGSAYSAGYIARCISISRRSFSSASANGTVLIQVIADAPGGSIRVAAALEQVAGRPAADGPAAHQLRRDELDRPPVPPPGEEVLGLGQQA